jgi:hypothetical protein
VTDVVETQLEARGVLGTYRAAVGWGTGRKPGAKNDQTFRVLAPPPVSK